MRRHILVVISVVAKVLDALCVFVLVCNDFANGFKRITYPSVGGISICPPLMKNPSGAIIIFAKVTIFRNTPKQKWRFRPDIYTVSGSVASIFYNDFIALVRIENVAFETRTSPISVMVGPIYELAPPCPTTSTDA